MNGGLFEMSAGLFRSRIASVCLLALLSGCKALDTLDRIVADPTQAISLHGDTTVTEVARSLRCNAPDNISRVTLLADRVAVAQWQEQRGIQLQGNEAIAEAPHALVDVGQRSSGGYGLAITRKAVLHEDGHLYLRATFVEPAEGAVVTQEITSPCVLVKLPKGNIPFVRVYDQTDRLRADSAQPGGVSDFLRWPF